MIGEGRGGPPAAPPTPRWRACGPYGSPAPGAPATLAAGTYLVSAAQPLKHWIEALLGQSPSASEPSTSDVNAWSRPLLMGVPGGTIGAPVPDAPAAAAPASPTAQPLAGRRLALLGDQAALASVPPGVEQPNAGTSWARWVLARLGAQVDVVDDAALAAGALAGHDALVVADGAPAALSAPALQAISGFVAAGGTYVGWRARGIAVAGAAGLTQATIAAGPATISMPGAAVAVGSSVVVDNDDPLIAGGHVVAGYGPVLSGWTSGSPAGRPAILDEPVGAGHAVLFAFDPVFRGASESAEALRHERADNRHSRCSMIRGESQIASASITSSGTRRWPLSFSISRAVALAPRHPDLLVVHPLAAQLARDAPARTQPVGRGAAAVQRGAHG